MLASIVADRRGGDLSLSSGGSNLPWEGSGEDSHLNTMAALLQQKLAAELLIAVIYYGIQRTDCATFFGDNVFSVRGS